MRRLVIAITAALALGGCAKDLPYADLKAKYATPASRFMALQDGVGVHYRDQGKADGQPIVMVHGFSANLDAWEPWVGQLGSDYRIITLDLAAHGLTTVPEGYQVSTEGQVAIVDQLTRALKVDHFVLAGNSMGGGVSWNYALAHPERVRALVLVDSVGLPPEPKAGEKPKGDGPPLVFMIMRSSMGRAILKQINPRPLAEKGLKQAYVDASLVTPALVDRYADLALAPGHRELLMSGRPAPRTPVTLETFQAIKAPTLVLHGEVDTVISADAGKALAAAIPGARLILYPGVGHVPMEQIPEKSAADVRAFLSGLPPTAKP